MVKRARVKLQRMMPQMKKASLWRQPNDQGSSSTEEEVKERVWCEKGWEDLSKRFFSHWMTDQGEDDLMEEELEGTSEEGCRIGEPLGRDEEGRRARDGQE